MSYTAVCAQSIRDASEGQMMARVSQPLRFWRKKCSGESGRYLG
jgi:hypothetical protein